MHVWAKNGSQYPFVHPYSSSFKEPPHEGTVEMLLADMDANGVTHSILVQVIYHGWDNRYVADCVRLAPDRLKAHGLIDPTDAKVADKLTYWMTEHPLAGMRFSPIYYRDGQQGGDDWITSEAHKKLWKRAAELGAVFNFFIASQQLAKMRRPQQLTRSRERVGQWG
jgi:predicted TIM-barrel fold metal-dependent hydrolase